MIDWFGTRRGPAQQPLPLGPSDMLRAPFLVVRGAKRNAVVYTVEQFRQLYPHASFDEVRAVEQALVSDVRAVRIIPGAPLPTASKP
jgi:hypothetical protein